MDQSKGYWCGPAAVQEALLHLRDSRGLNVSVPTQSALANDMKTDTSGTAWSGIYVAVSVPGGATGRPVPDVLNHYLANYSTRYYPVEVASATSTNVDNFKTRVMADISSKSPLIGDAWETTNSTYHLVGHPEDRTIFHWYTMMAYSSYGGYVRYEDSAHSPYVSWGSGVPEYSTLGAVRHTTIMSGRGYVW
ncbi:C39 family peptidase [Actinomycetota bacterium]